MSAAAAAPRGHRRSVSAGVLPQSLDAGAMDPALELADAALTLSGPRTTAAAGATNGTEVSPRTAGRSGMRGRGKSVSNRRSMAAGGDGGVGAASSPRRGKYQVKDSFNRLKGWINGGFAGNGGRKNVAAASSTKGAGAAAKSRKAAGGGGGDGTRAVNRSGDRRSSSAAPGHHRASAPPPRGGATGGKGAVDSKNLTPSAAVDRAAARVEARRAAEREAIKSARGGDAARASAKPGATRSSPRTKAAGATIPAHRRKSVSKNASPSNRSPAAPTALAGARGGNGGASERTSKPAGAGRPAASAAVVGNNAQQRGRSQTRGLEVAMAGASMSPSSSPSPLPGTGPSDDDEAMAAAVAAAAVGAAASAVGAPRRCKAVPAAAAAVALSPASGRMAVVPPALTPAGQTARVKTSKAAKSLGATVPALSSASSPRKACDGSSAATAAGTAAASPRLGSRSRVPLESPGPMRSPRTGDTRSKSRSPRSGGFGREGGFFGGRSGKSAAAASGGGGEKSMRSPSLRSKPSARDAVSREHSGSQSSATSTPTTSKGRKPGRAVRVA